MWLGRMWMSRGTAGTVPEAIGSFDLVALEPLVAEVGLASLTSLLFGITVTVYGVAVIRSPVYPIWVGFLAILGGLGTTAGGVVLAYTGFSESMMISMLANRLLLVWMIVVGVLMWRRVDEEHLGNSVA